MVNLRVPLQKYFGYSEFRPLQEQIIADILAKKDVFVLMPTGGGKSLCYQLPALLQEGLTIVISPLISLMKDQVDSLLRNGIKAAFLNSSLNYSQQQKVKDALRKNQIKLLYIAPERLTTDDFLAFLKEIHLSLIAVDEAHCISQWGHDFRPEYRQLTKVRNIFNNTPVIALTATATKHVKEDILTQLQILEAKVYQASFDRPNLYYSVLQKQSEFDQLITIINQHEDEAGIIYCQTRKDVDRLAIRLKNSNLKALPYHAGLDDETRHFNQDQFIKENINLIVATVAFGMGIDKPNVRFVVHMDLPANLERYYQETGRAGRDGLPSDVTMLFSIADIFTIKSFIRQKESFEQQRVAQNHLNQVVDFAQSYHCRRVQLLKYFGEDYPITKCQNCDNCLNPKAQFNATILTQKILSCIARTKERFGKGYIIKILLGQNDQRITQNGHDKLTTFGIVNEYTEPQLRNLIDQLVLQGYIVTTEDLYQVLGLSPKSLPVLKNNQIVELFVPPVQLPKKSKKLREKVFEEHVDERLFQKLKALRKSIADKENVPPYIIFSDVSLRQMASSLPQNKEQFSKIYGVGENKLKNYGDIFIDEVKTHLESV